MTSDLISLIRAELAQPIDPRATQLAHAIAAHHGAASEAVLFYGSCLRQAELDGLMLDFYLIVSDYDAAFDRRWLAVANRALPPNVFPFQAHGLAAKYAVLSRADFIRLAAARTRNVSVWARFSQPSRLAWVRDEAARTAAITAIAGAAPALLAAAWPMTPQPLAPLDLWRLAYQLTYQAELRAERRERAASVVESDPERYHAFSRPALEAAGIAPNQAASPAAQASARWAWRRRRIEGKLLSIARLAKASLTFAGGIDYLAWKINRHAGTAITIKPWQRRWPILGALILLPRLLKGGAIR